MIRGRDIQPSAAMLAKYAIDYTLFPQHNKRTQTHRTSDPVEAEDFLMHLMAGGDGSLPVRGRCHTQTTAKPAGTPREMA